MLLLDKNADAPAGRVLKRLLRTGLVALGGLDAVAGAELAQRAGRFVGVPEQLAQGAGRPLNLIKGHVLALEAEPRNGAVSEAQLDGCESHVDEATVDGYYTNAARYARGELSECLADSGPFCEPR